MPLFSPGTWNTRLRLFFYHGGPSLLFHRGSVSLLIFCSFWKGLWYSSFILGVKKIFYDCLEFQATFIQQLGPSTSFNNDKNNFSVNSWHGGLPCGWPGNTFHDTVLESIVIPILQKRKLSPHYHHHDTHTHTKKKTLSPALEIILLLLLLEVPPFNSLCQLLFVRGWGLKSTSMSDSLFWAPCLGRFPQLDCWPQWTPFLLCPFWDWAHLWRHHLLSPNNLSITLHLETGDQDGPQTSLVISWMRIHLPVRSTWVQSLVQKDSTCFRSTKPMHHNYWACTQQPGSCNYWAHVLQLLKASCLEPVLCNKRNHCNEKPMHANEE